MPNAIMKAKSERRRPFIGDQVDECRDVSGLYYILPMQKVININSIKNKKKLQLSFFELTGLFAELGHTERCLGLFAWQRLLQCPSEYHINSADSTLLQFPVYTRRHL